MKKYKRNILLIFGYLIVIAILFVPFKYLEGSYKIEFGERHFSWEEIDKGYMFLPVLIVKSTQRKHIKLDYGNYYYRHVFNLSLLTTEIVLIILTAGFAYIIFCVVLRKRG